MPSSPVFIARGVRRSRARFERSGQEPQTRTVMAFGPSAKDIRDLLAEGRPVDLAVQFDGGTVKIIGSPRERQAKAAQAQGRQSAPKESSMPEQLLLACIASGGYDQNDRFEHAA